MDFYNEYILVNYLESALRSCDLVTKKGNKYHFRCNICGDSQKSRTKKRAWILKNRKGIWIFNCFNSCGSMGALTWLKTKFPDVYRNYIKEILSRHKTKIGQENKPVQIQEVQKQETKKQILYPFKSLASEKYQELDMIKDAIDFCVKRKIPKDVWSKFFVCDDGKYANRLIIPFYNDSQNKIYYFQARTLYGKGEKYISMEGEKKIYNIFNIDKSKPVMITEGMIDSLFLENSIAIAGLRMSENIEEQLKDLCVYFLLDSDKDARKKSIELIKQGRFVFNWYKFKKDFHLPDRDKWDINEVVLYLNRNEKFLFEELKKYFTNNFLDSIYFK